MTDNYKSFYKDILTPSTYQYRIDDLMTWDSGTPDREQKIQALRELISESKAKPPKPPKWTGNEVE